MALTDDVHKAILEDDLEKFNSLLYKNNETDMLDIIIEKINHTILVQGAVKILQKCLRIPAVFQRIQQDAELRKTMLICAVGSDNGSSLAVLNLLLEYPNFVDHIKRDSLEIIKGATQNKLFANILQLVQEILEYPEAKATETEEPKINGVTQIIDANCDSFWESVYYGSVAARNRLLEFPSIFDLVDCDLIPGNPNLREFLNTEFMEYYFSRLQQRMAEFNNTYGDDRKYFDVSGPQEARLGYLILRNLISTYPIRDEIRKDVQREQQEKSAADHKSTYSWAYSLYRSFRTKTPPVNVHLQRIKLLLTLPSVQRRATHNNNELLRMAVGMTNSFDDDLITALLGMEEVKSHYRTFPINIQHEKQNPINLRDRYLEQHPGFESARNSNKTAITMRPNS